ncbi:MAG: hypothetical protein KDA32_08505 [Phycisphaerales bacterium]|nr:hypothetical protein [Phycisphaerales bacterium]
MADLLRRIAQDLQTPLLDPRQAATARWTTSVVVHCADLPPTLGSAPCMEITPDHLHFATARPLPEGRAEVEFEDLLDHPKSPVEIEECQAVTEGIFQVKARFVAS